MQDSDGFMGGLNPDADLNEIYANKDKIKSEFQSIKEVEELKKAVEKQATLLHAMWLLLKDSGITNEQFNDRLQDAVNYRKHTNFKSEVVCPSCGKNMQKLENVPFTYKCYYCGEDGLVNPYLKYDNIDPNQNDFVPDSNQKKDEESPNYEGKTYDEIEYEKEIAAAQKILSQEYKPYDVSKDLNFDDQDV